MTEAKDCHNKASKNKVTRSADDAVCKQFINGPYLINFVKFFF